MKKLILALAVFLAPVFAVAAQTNFPGGIGVGTSGASTYIVLTGVATTTVEIPVGSWHNGEYTDLSSPAKTLNAGIGAHVSHTAATFAALAAAEHISMTAQVTVPANIKANQSGTLYGEFTTSASDTATSVTAAVLINRPGSAFTWTATADSAIVVPSTSATTPVTVQLNDNETYSPGDEVNIIINRTAGSTATLYLRRLYLKLVPYSIMP